MEFRHFSATVPIMNVGQRGEQVISDAPIGIGVVGTRVPRDKRVARPVEVFIVDVPAHYLCLSGRHRRRSTAEFGRAS